jgi:hypothetical protein
MKESELYEPIKDLFIKQGFQVKAEVKDIDILASKDDCYIAVELKTAISIKLIYQAIDRQKTMDMVYVGLPKSALPKQRKRYQEWIYLLKRLEIGLIIVDHHQAEVLIDTDVFNLEKSRRYYKKRKQTILKEYHLRKNDQNIGGTKGKRITSYKEMVVEIGLYLLEYGPSSPKIIKEKTKILKTASILQKNYNQYFARVSRGLYDLTDLGKKEILELNQMMKVN